MKYATFWTQRNRNYNYLLLTFYTMKKLLLFAALVLGAVSCMKDNSFDANAGGEAEVVLSVALPADVTRAINQDSADGAIGNIDLANEYDIRYILEVYDAGKNLAKRVEQFEAESTSTTFALRLIPGRAYTFVVWADFVAQGTEEALHYDAESLREIEIIGVQNAMDESRDAYTGTYYVENFSSSSQIGFELKRPFAKLRVVTNDIDEIYSSLVGATIEYTAETYQQYDALTAQSSEPTTKTKTVDYTSDAYKYAGEPTTEGVQTLFADYILGTQNGTVQFIMTVEDSVQELPAVNFNTAIPVQTNYLTTIYGPILTDSNNVTVTINPAFENEGKFEEEPWYVEVWDGTSVTEPVVETVVDEATGEAVEVVVIDQPSDLAWLADFVNGNIGFANASVFATRAGNEPVNFELRANIDLANYPWTPIGTPENNFVGTFNGNGFSIGNLNIVVDEAKEGKAYMGLFGYAKNVTIKNLILANANVNVACLDIDHSQGHIAALVGSLEGNSTIENVTVRGDIKIYATETANGASRVGVIAGGNSGYYNVTMKNVHVEANEGSYLRANNNAGALAGQLMGKNTFENCSSNINVTVNKFFAGGLIGIAGDGDTYTNCHSTGNIAVVAGREGRHNDEYRVGGIAGGWSDGPKNVFTLVNCSYTGNISGQNTDGTIAEPLDYAGYVGRGYALTNCAGSKVVVNGVTYIQKYNDVYGVYENENGYEYVADGLLYNGKEYIAISAKGLVALSEKTIKGGETVKLGADIDLKGVEFNGLNAFNPEPNNTFDGQGYTVSNWTYTGKANDMGFIRNWVGPIKNLTIKNAILRTGGRSAVIVAKPYGNIENCHVVDCNLQANYWACGLIAGMHNSGNMKNCSATNSYIYATGGTAAITGVLNEAGGVRTYENCSVTGCTINNGGDDPYAGAAIVGLINIDNATVEFNNCTKSNNTNKGTTKDQLYGYTCCAVKIDGGIVVNTVEEFTAALKDANVNAIVLGQDITVTEKWDNRYTGAKTSKAITIDGNGNTLKFACEVSDGFNYQAAFRFEAAAVVKNLTIDMSEVPGTGSWLRAISTKGDITVDNCTFIGNANYTSGRGIAYGEGAGAAAADIVVSVKNSTFTNWTRRGLTDNENAQDAKNVTVVNNTFTNADAYVSAHDSIVFTGNTMTNSAANFRSYSNATDATVVATGNTLDANNANNVIRGFVAANVESQEGFTIL